MSDADLDQYRQRGQERANEPLTEETVFEVLSNGRRRYVFHFLKKQQRRVYLRELAEHVAAWENDKPIAQLTSAETKRVKTALHQHHLPKMDTSGFVTYDSSRETVSLSEDVADLDVYLDVVPGVDVPWSLYYLGLSGVGMLALVCTLVDTGPLSLVTGFSAAIFLTAAVFISAVAHAYLNYTRLRLGSTTEPPEMVD
jgi:hypothetical protein